MHQLGEKAITTAGGVGQGKVKGAKKSIIWAWQLHLGVKPLISHTGVPGLGGAPNPDSSVVIMQMWEAAFKNSDSWVLPTGREDVD